MPNLSQTKKLGLSLGPQETYLAEIKHLPNRFEVANLVDLNFSIPFNFSTINDKDALEDIGNNLKSVLLTEKIDAKNLYISLDYSMANIKRLPIDNNLNEKELQEHVLWEFNQHLISPIDEYNFDFQKLPRVSLYKYPSILIAAVKKKIIDAVKFVADVSTLDLKLVDINIFSSINTLEANYRLRPGKKTASIEIAKDKLIFIILEGSTLLGFHPIHLEEELNEDSSLENISDTIIKNLRFLISDYDTREDKTEFDNVFLFKKNKGLNISGILELEEDSKFEILNPLNKLPVSSGLKDKLSPDLDYSEYTESIGLIIRK